MTSALFHAGVSDTRSAFLGMGFTFPASATDASHRLEGIILKSEAERALWDGSMFSPQHKGAAAYRLRIATCKCYIVSHKLSALTAVASAASCMTNPVTEGISWNMNMDVVYLVARIHYQCYSC